MGSPDQVKVEVVKEPQGGFEIITMAKGSTVGDLIREMGLLREEYIVLLKDKVVTEFEKLLDGDRVRLVRAFSGG